MSSREPVTFLTLPLSSAFLRATILSYLSFRAQPRNLQFVHPLTNAEVNTIRPGCHPDRSGPGFPTSLHSTTATYATLSREAHETYRSRRSPQETRGSVAEGSAVLPRLPEPSGCRNMQPLPYKPMLTIKLRRSSATETAAVLPRIRRHSFQ